MNAKNTAKNNMNTVEPIDSEEMILDNFGCLQLTKSDVVYRERCGNFLANKVGNSSWWQNKSLLIGDLTRDALSTTHLDCLYSRKKNIIYQYKKALNEVKY